VSEVRGRSVRGRVSSCSIIGVRSSDGEDKGRGRIGRVEEGVDRVDYISSMSKAMSKRRGEVGE